jgi:hypothetical protein
MLGASSNFVCPLLYLHVNAFFVPLGCICLFVPSFGECFIGFLCCLHSLALFMMLRIGFCALRLVTLVPTPFLVVLHALWLLGL